MLSCRHYVEQGDDQPNEALSFVWETSPLGSREANKFFTAVIQASQERLLVMITPANALYCGPSKISDRKCGRLTNEVSRTGMEEALREAPWSAVSYGSEGDSVGVWRRITFGILSTSKVLQPSTIFETPLLQNHLLLVSYLTHEIEVEWP